MSRRSQDIDHAVGLRIASRRSALGLSQSALGRELGISFQQVQKYESGTNRVSASRLHQIAVALGCSVAEFFPSQHDDPKEGAAGMKPLIATAEGRAIAAAFPRIPDLAVRHAVSRVVEALASA